jgi:uncharacterized protein YgiM (DUF1202 family)
MTVRHSPVRSAVKFSIICIAATLAISPLARSAWADPTTVAPAADAAQQAYYGILNQDNVYIRSGPSDVFYATAKLNKGAKVTVVAVREPWLKIVPPEGSYCYVARAYVEKRGDGTVGRVTKAELNVRAGSTLNGLKTTVLTSLAEGDDVKILGEQDEYFKIAPPPGAYLYIMKTYVDPAPQAAGEQPIVAAPAKSGDPIASAPIPVAVTPPAAAPVAAAPVAPAPVAPAPAPVAPAPVAPTVAARTAPAPTPVAVAPAVAPAPAPVAPAPAPVAPPTPAPVAAAPAPVAPVASAVAYAKPASALLAAATTQPTVVESSTATTQPTVAAVPTTQPVVAISADARFDAVESSFLDATQRPLDQQPLNKLLTEYTSLSTDPQLPLSMRRITEMRIATIKLRADAQQQYLEAKKMDADAQARKLALKAEHEELAQKAKDQQLAMYTVLGTLRISSLQQSGTTLYRITDPAGGHTLLYLKSNDPKYTDLVDQFIGVRGDITEDSNLNLKVITPTGVEKVDPAKVNTTVTATLIPPSMLPKASTASVGN